jgi:hypothetical protein
MMADREPTRKPPAGEQGQVMLEYTLLLAVFGIPMILVARLLLNTMSAHYGIVSWMETLPLP